MIFGPILREKFSESGIKCSPEKMRLFFGVKLGLKVVIFRFFSFLGPEKTTKYFSDFRSKYIKIRTSTSTVRFGDSGSIAVAQFYSCCAQSRRFVATWHRGPAVSNQLHSDQKGHEPDQHIVGDFKDSAFR